MDKPEKLQELQQKYSLDNKEFGKILIVASLTLLAVSIHAIYAINGAVEQASETEDRMEDTAIILGSDSFQQGMESLADTGATIDGQDIDELVEDLQYTSESVESMEELSNELDHTRTVYQWTVLIGLLGLVAGITSIYI